MYIYMTNGTFDFLQKLKDKYPKEKMLLMQNNEGAVLIHETFKKTLFSAPRRYEVIESIGNLENTGFVALHHIPVTDDDKPTFEYRFKNNAKQLQSFQGFTALRVLRPIKSNMYVVLTLWIDEKSYIGWEKSQVYQSFFQDTKAISTQTKMFMGSAYVSKYYIAEE
ncbi:antibiotic biosynthesis monooxygenase [Cytobacillus depressus]|uniref:Antibiotic biosynthesis monooxygenase n=1 Tax=Cytobacillus depressus TaxID=1602942 RepID=A0A6L3VCT1_9BACI|nr:antibiotic biosynthesis monooxygenase [Cytobacillus depressus]KAB2337141.1 antibiotic biosynthesis monooxygenase [Cytobacillus depressus]